MFDPFEKRSIFIIYEPCHEKTCFCTCENKGADRAADRHLCYHYKDSTLSLLPKSDISSL